MYCTDVSNNHYSIQECQVSEESRFEAIFADFTKAIKSQDEQLIQKYLDEGIYSYIEEYERRLTYRPILSIIQDASETNNMRIVKQLFDGGFANEARRRSFHNRLDEDEWYLSEDVHQFINIPWVYKNLPLLELFLQYGAKPNKTWLTHRPLDDCIESSNPEESIDLLVKYGADVTLVDWQTGNTLIQSVILDNKHFQKKHSFELKERVILKFVEKGVDINAKNNAGQTALDMADSEEMRQLIHRIVYLSEAHTR